MPMNKANSWSFCLMQPPHSPPKIAQRQILRDQDLSPKMT